MADNSISQYANRLMQRYDRNSDGQISIRPLAGIFQPGGLFGDLMRVLSDETTRPVGRIDYDNKVDIDFKVKSIRHLAKSADTNFDGEMTQYEMESFVANKFDKNKNGKLGWMERMKFKWSEFAEKTYNFFNIND
jgi:Ca2+-binding EF-hand superfamily protein